MNPLDHVPAQVTERNDNLHSILVWLPIDVSERSEIYLIGS